MPLPLYGNGFRWLETPQPGRRRFRSAVIVSAGWKRPDPAGAVSALRESFPLAGNAATRRAPLPLYGNCFRRPETPEPGGCPFRSTVIVSAGWKRPSPAVAVAALR
jgi:hypothetical protein